MRCGAAQYVVACEKLASLNFHKIYIESYVYEYKRRSGRSCFAEACDIVLLDRVKTSYCNVMYKYRKSGGICCENGEVLSVQCTYNQ